MKIFTRTKNILSPLPRFGFWVTAVNLNNKRGVERVQTYANTIIDVDCVNQTGEAEKVLVMILCVCNCAQYTIVQPPGPDTWSLSDQYVQVLSKSCYALTPSWNSKPYIEQLEASKLQ